MMMHDRSPLRIAVADDEEDLSSLYSRLLVRLGYSAPVMFSDGISVADSVAKDPRAFDMIIMDFQMPGMNGIEASKVIFEHAPEMKIILVTASDSVEATAVSMGLFFLQKPFSLKTIEEVLKSVEVSMSGGESTSARRRRLSSNPTA